MALRKLIPKQSQLHKKTSLYEMIDFGEIVPGKMSLWVKTYPFVIAGLYCLGQRTLVLRVKSVC
jgi:hypothetical protein